MRIFLFLMIVLFVPSVALAGNVDKELQKQLGHTPCIKSWNYNKSAFKILFSPNNCKPQECNASLLTIRYIFESNKAKFPKKIIINTGSQVQTYPFENIPTLITK